MSWRPHANRYTKHTVGYPHFRNTYQSSVLHSRSHTYSAHHPHTHTLLRLVHSFTSSCVFSSFNWLLNLQAALISHLHVFPQILLQMLSMGSSCFNQCHWTVKRMLSLTKRPIQSLGRSDELKWGRGGGKRGRRSQTWPMFHSRLAAVSSRGSLLALTLASPCDYHVPSRQTAHIKFLWTHSPASCTAQC